jgi:hypothetical protein
MELYFCSHCFDLIWFPVTLIFNILNRFFVVVIALIKKINAKRSQRDFTGRYKTRPNGNGKFMVKYRPLTGERRSIVTDTECSDILQFYLFTIYLKMMSAARIIQRQKDDQ